VRLMKYRPEVAPWQFRLHRLRRLHRKICHVDGRVAFVGGINLIDDMNTPRHKPPRVDFAVRVEGPLLAAIVMTMQRLWALVELTQFDRSDVPLFPVPIPTQVAGSQSASFAIRDNLGHRRDIEAAYLSAIRMAGKEIVIATAYFFPGAQFRRALAAAAERGVKVTLLLQARVEYRLLHYLMMHQGRVISRTELVEHLYDQDFDRDSNTIEVFVGRIRKKLEVDIIQTVRGLGYLLTPPSPGT